MQVRIEVNGIGFAADVEPRKTLADLLRDDCGQTGTHLGCEHGACGSCTVLVDGTAVRSCLMFAVQAEGHAVTTIEGLTPRDGIGPVQQALREEHGLQCGFCTPGIVVAIHALLRENPAPTRDDVVHALAGNLCRCTGYQGIVRAALRAADTLAAASAAEAEASVTAAQAATGTVHR